MLFRSDFNVYKVRSSETGTIYMKIKSFGDYNGTNVWKEATEYVNKINSTYSAIYLPAQLVEKHGVSPSSAEIDPILNQYVLPYYPSILNNTVIQSGDIICSGDASSKYTAYFYPDHLIKEIARDDVKTNDFELEYRKFVYANYLNIDVETYEYMNKLIEINDFSAEDPNILDKVARFISTSAKYDLAYDRSLDRENNVAIAFLEDYKTGICQHYATAATLLFRTLGIPARYTIGFSTDTVAGEWVNVKSKEAHAWVEVYLDRIGWVYVEVTGGMYRGNAEESSSVIEPPYSTPYETQIPVTPDITLPPQTPPITPETSDVPDTPHSPYTSEYPTTGTETPTEPPQSIAKTPIFISPAKVEKLYDGTPLTAINEIKGFKEYEDKGYTYEVVITGRRTTPGKSTSQITEITIFNPSGTDVTDEFEINTFEGTIHVYVKEVRVVSGSESKTYDGTPVTNDNVVLLTPIDNIIYTTALATGSRTNVGTSKNSFKISFFDVSGIDITDNYKIISLYGNLTINPAEITIKADDASKKFDGSPLECDSFTLDGVLATGDQIVKCDLIGSQTEIGRSENTIDANSIKIENSNGEDVTDNYVINLVSGILRVTP